MNKTGSNQDVWEPIIHHVERESLDCHVSSGGFYRREKIYTSSYEIFSLLPEDLQAAEPRQMGTLVNIGIIKHKRNEYTDGSPAYQLEYVVTVIDAIDHAIISERTFLGGPPPTSIRKSSPEGVGASPAGDVAKWLISLPEGPLTTPDYVISSVGKLQQVFAEEREPNEQVVVEALESIVKRRDFHGGTELFSKLLLCKNDAIVIMTLECITKLGRAHLESVLPSLLPLIDREETGVQQAILDSITSVQTQHEEAFSLTRQIIQRSDDREIVVSCLKLLPQFGDQATPIIALYLSKSHFRVTAIESVHKLYANNSMGNELLVQVVAARDQLVLRSEIDGSLEIEASEQHSREKALELANDLLGRNGVADRETLSALLSAYHRERFHWEPSDWKRYRSIEIPFDEVETIEFLDSGYVVQTISRTNRTRKHCAMVANVPEVVIDAFITAASTKSTLGDSNAKERDAMQAPRVDVQPKYANTSMQVARDGFVFALPANMGRDDADFVDAVVSHDGNLVVVADTNGMLYFFDGKSGLLIFKLNGTDKPIIDIAIDRSQGVIALLTNGSIDIIIESDLVNGK